MKWFLLGLLVWGWAAPVFAAGTLLTLGAGASGGGGVSPFTTWDPANSNTNITFSGANLTGTKINFASNAVTFSAHDLPPKAYSEFVLGLNGVATDSAGVGFGNAAASFNVKLGTQPYGVATYQVNGMILNSVGLLAFTFANGDVLSLAYNSTSKKLWIRKNCGLWNNSGSDDPATDTGGIDTSSITGSVKWAANLNQVGQSVTANFGASAWSCTIPSGFTGVPS